MANARKKAFRNNRRKKKAQEPKGVAMKVMDRFSKFSALSDNNLEQIVGSDEFESVIKELKDNGFVELGVKEVKIKRNKVKYYRLTNKGINFLKAKDYEIYSSNSARHDVLHATNVLDNFSSEQIDNYKHEKQLYSYKNRDDISRVDGAIENRDGSIILIETITRNYKPSQIAAKQAYADSYQGGGCEYKVFDEMKRR